MASWPTHRYPDPSFALLQRCLGLSSNSNKTKADDPDVPPPLSIKHDAILISVDIEAWEHDNSAITELGFAILDTRDIENTAPGLNGENWFEHVKARHFLDKTRLHLINHTFVTGDPDGFLFGETKRFKESQLRGHLRRILRHGFENPGNEHRNVILVVHDKAAEERLMGFLDVKAFEGAKVMYTADTQIFAQPKADGKVGLGRLCELLDIDACGAHNAGNDAVYTMQALLRMVCWKTFDKGRLLALRRALG